MKLPEEIKRTACRLQMPTTSEMYEAMVRDCAKIASNEDCDQTEYNCRTVLRIEKAILARYGLEP